MLFREIDIYKQTLISILRLFCRNEFFFYIKMAYIKGLTIVTK